MHEKGGPGGCPARLLVLLLCVPSASLCARLGRDDVHGPAAVAPGELNRAADQREQRVVAADALAGVEVRAALADEDLARVHDLTAVTLDAEALGLGVAAVAAG